jgi:hypothetical protein
LQADTNKPLPTEVDHSHRLPPVRNQGPRPTCTAFALTELSDEMLFWGSKQIERSNIAAGISFRSAHLALGKYGQITAGLWPYHPFLLSVGASYTPPAEALNPANCFRAGLSAIDVDIHVIRRSLANGNLVAVTIQVSAGLFVQNGNIPMPDITDLRQDYHAVLLTGYTDETLDASSGTFRFRNSWGAAWGENGYGKLPYGYLSRYCPAARILNRMP